LVAREPHGWRAASEESFER